MSTRRAAEGPATDGDGDDGPTVAARSESFDVDGSIDVRSIRWTDSDEPELETELELCSGPMRLVGTVDREETRQLRDALLDDDTTVVGRDGGVRVGQAVCAEHFATTITVEERRLLIRNRVMDWTVVLDDELTARLVDELDAALDDPSVIE